MRGRTNEEALGFRRAPAELTLTLKGRRSDLMDRDAAQDQLTRMVTGYWISQALYVAAKLNIADLLDQKEQPAEEWAQATGTHAPSRYRVLRAVASVGVFAE